MSDDPKDNPPVKLQLSRDLKSQVEDEAANQTGHQTNIQRSDRSDAPGDKSDKVDETDHKEDDTAAGQTPPPVMKLKLRPLYDPSTESEESPKSSSQIKQEFNSLSAAETSKQSQPETHNEPPSTQADATIPTSNNRPSFNPKNPFGHAIKDSEMNAPRQASTHSDSETLKASSHSTEQLEKTIKQLETPAGQASSKNSILPSIIVICILLIALSAASFGLWMLLAPADSENLTDSSETTSANESRHTSPESAVETPATKKVPTGPIQRAKDTIAKVPIANIDAITAEDSQESAPTAVKMESSSAAVIDQMATTGSTLPATTELEPTAPVSDMQTRSALADKEIISEYLSAIHIGGLRKGDRPMVLIEGKSFLVGEIVHEATGLKFDGIRDGRLAFRDTHGIVYLKSF
jgi:hypothetical protein